MSPGMFSEALNLLTPFSGIFSRGPEIDFFLRGGTGNFAKNGQILRKFQVCIFHSVKSVRTSGSRNHHLGIIFKYKQCPNKIF